MKFAGKYEYPKQLHFLAVVFQRKSFDYKKN